MQPRSPYSECSISRADTGSRRRRFPLESGVWLAAASRCRCQGTANHVGRQLRQAPASLHKEKRRETGLKMFKRPYCPRLGSDSSHALLRACPSLCVVFSYSLKWFVLFCCTTSMQDCLKKREPSSCNIWQILSYGAIVSIPVRFKLSSFKDRVAAKNKSNFFKSCPLTI